MALSQSDVDRLEAAVARGELTVEYDGRRVTYRSMNELLQALAYVKGEVQNQAGSAQQNRMSYVQFDRGLRD